MYVDGVALTLHVHMQNAAYKNAHHPPPRIGDSSDAGKAMFNDTPNYLFPYCVNPTIEYNSQTGSECSLFSPSLNKTHYIIQIVKPQFNVEIESTYIRQGHGHLNTTIVITSHLVL
jgi:hypothetical protein